MKKALFILSIAGLAVCLNACSGSRDRYLDLTTGQPLELEKDAGTGLMVNKTTGEPATIYVDRKTADTIYGKTGEVINGHVVIRGNKYMFDGDEKLKMEDNGELKYKDGDHKTKVDKDGDMKIKNGDRKVKIDEETGDKKVKND